MESPSPLSKANTAFALALLKKLSDEDNAANVFFSPFSISSALAMVMLGARGSTAQQMSEVLEMPCQVSTTGPEKGLNIHAGFAKLLRELNRKDAPYALSVANRLYGEQSFQFLKDFLDSIRKYYGAELESVNFKTRFEAARVTINNWVEKQTQGKIKDLLVKGVLNDMSRLVLVNAIYFKGNWNKQFDERDTMDAEFRINKNEKRKVKMMYQNTRFPLRSIPEIKSQILEMPYKGNELSMLIFLPDEIEDSTTGLEKLERELTNENFVEWTRPERRFCGEVHVNLPKFKLEEKYDMKDVLISMGMADVFDPAKCDLSGMCPGKELHVSEVIHKAFVEVNETGTEAAAATAVVGLVGCSPFAPPPDTFFADHPFLFFIRHNPSMSILFAGRYCSPE